jgi:hypothetical protein
MALYTHSSTWHNNNKLWKKGEEMAENCLQWAHAAHETLAHIPVLFLHRQMKRGGGGGV